MLMNDRNEMARSRSVPCRTSRSRRCLPCINSPRHGTAWRSFQGTQRDGLGHHVLGRWPRAHEHLFTLSYSYMRLLFVLRYIKRREEHVEYGMPAAKPLAFSRDFCLLNFDEVFDDDLRG